MANISKAPKPAADPGQQLRRAREKLRLKYRDVEEASRRIAVSNHNSDFFIGLSRLADIENRGTVPSIYRLYSLCAIYGLDWSEVLEWYGIKIGSLPGDSALSVNPQTRLVNQSLSGIEQIDIPELSTTQDLRKTFFLSREIAHWGPIPLVLLNSLNLGKQKYAFLGTDDWSMYPILVPGSFLQIDETKTKIRQESWIHEIERPIYFLEHREGYRCAWCTQADKMLILQPHWSAQEAPQVYRFPGEVEVVGQVVGVAMRLATGKRLHKRFSGVPG